MKSTRVIVVFIFLLGLFSQPIVAKNIPLYLPFKYIVVPGKEAMNAYKRLKVENKNICLPVILGKYEDIQMLSENLKDSKDLALKTISKASKFHIDQFIKSRIEQDSEYYKSVTLGIWPANTDPMTDITAYKDILTGKPFKEVYIGLIPTIKPYEIPAYLNFGGWNECPSPEDQVGICKYWYEKYGAQVIAVTSDTFEFVVEHPPQTKKEAIDLARKQFVYCSDIVYQGTDSISGLAATLLNSKYWYFWWD